MKPEAMWHAYLEKAKIERPAGGYEAWHFCSEQKEADDLAVLTKKGIKRGTAGLVKAYEAEKEPLPRVGEHHIITDWAGEAACVIRIKEVEIFPFNEVTQRHATIEGEGDGSLAYWIDGHRKFFQMDAESLGFSFEETDEVVFLIFDVVYPTDQKEE